MSAKCTQTYHSENYLLGSLTPYFDVMRAGNELIGGDGNCIFTPQNAFTGEGLNQIKTDFKDELFKYFYVR